MNIFTQIIINITILILMYLYINNKISKKLNSKTIINDINVEVEEIITELNRTTERNILLLENKIKSLEDYFLKAEKLITTATSEIDKRDLAFEKYKNMKKNIQLNMPFKDEDKSENRDVKELVQNYHNNGISSDVISKKLNLPIGEIELIISLNKNALK